MKPGGGDTWERIGQALAKMGGSSFEATGVNLKYHRLKNRAKKLALKGGKTMEVNKDYVKWLVGSDVGVSSRTIMEVMLGMADPKHEDAWRKYSTPSDPADFGRCHRLLERFPEFKPRLASVVKIFPKWGPLVREWDKLTVIYLKELKNPDGMAPVLYAKMQVLLKEGGE